ncbi:putative siderophore iron transporter [Periconia macrospinosa]|uniref:Putative siderophore iron transporter n=1 Tax=Periconia macrospinosa TaxID=97972 RepID=A0A2V1CX47_9PLEO|nr:putative siderophore iron transporter [Periconia macrospinosa]
MVSSVYSVLSKTPLLSTEYRIQHWSWVSTSLSLVQAVLAPIIASISDTFQARKYILVGASLVSCAGCAVAPGSQSMNRLIGAQILIGFGFSAAPLAYVIPSEIAPRKWRPMVQATMNIAACLGAIAGPLSIGALTRSNPKDGWRTYFWIEMGLWAIAVAGIMVGYHPPKRHTRYDHLTVWQKLGRTDFVGSGLLAAGLTLLMTGLSLGGNQYRWTNSRVLATLIVGSIALLSFGAYEWKGTKTGIFHHDLFRREGRMGRTFALCLFLMFLEGVLFFAMVNFYPILTTMLFEQDSLLVVLRGQPYFMVGMVSAVFWGYVSTRFQTIREPLFAGYLIMTAGMAAMATIQPNDSASAIGFASLQGIGVGAPLILIITGVQLATPHSCIATATGVTTSARSLAASMFTAIYAAAMQTRLQTKIPAYVAKAAAQAGLPPSSIGAFVGAIASQDTAALSGIPGVSQVIVGAGGAALKQAYADSVRVVFIIGAPFGVVACVASLFLGDLRQTMNYSVDAPIEDLHASGKRQQENVTGGV